MRKLLLALLILLPVTTFAGIEQDSQRLTMCDKVYKENKEFVDSIYSHTPQDIVVRCAVYAQLIKSYESDYWKSRKCIEDNNCFGLKRGWSFIKFKTREEGLEYFVTKYFRWHFNKTAHQLIYGYWMDWGWKFWWSVTDKPTYYKFVSENYWKTYYNLTN